MYIFVGWARWWKRCRWWFCLWHIHTRPQIICIISSNRKNADWSHWLLPHSQFLSKMARSREAGRMRAVSRRSLLHSACKMADVCFAFATQLYATAPPCSIGCCWLEETDVFGMWEESAGPGEKKTPPQARGEHANATQKGWKWNSWLVHWKADVLNSQPACC